MKIKNALILTEDFIPAFDELLKKSMPARQCLQMIESLDELINHDKILRMAQITIVKKYARVDEKGELVFAQNGDAIFDTPEKETECKKELHEIRDEFFEIPLEDKVQIYEDDVSTPRKLFLLKDIVEVISRPVPEQKS